MAVNFRAVLGIGIATLCAVVWSLDLLPRWSSPTSGDGKADTSGTPSSPARARELEIIRSNVETQGDPALGEEYRRMNERYFSGALPDVPVAWEPALEDVGPLTADGFVLEGLWGQIGQRTVILLNPVLRDDERRRERTLCHEMVHQYLFSAGAGEREHGPAFQQQLRRLSEEGAFEGIAASEGERAQLRAWLNDESARLDSQDAELAEMRREIDPEREALERLAGELNARTAAANARGSGWPPEDEINAVTSRQEVLRQRMDDFNQRLDRRNADGADFNREAHRFNLMMSYPDGLDDATVVRPKAPGRGGVQR